MIPYTTVRSKRKTIGLYYKNGAFEVRAPLKVSDKYIDGFVMQKQGWMQEMLNKNKQYEIDITACTALPFNGTLYPVVRRSCKPRFDGKTFYLADGITSKELGRLYASLARPVFTALIEQYSAVTGTKPGKLTVTGAQTRWGSCSGKNNISLSWRLMLCPQDSIKYVVIHELTHIKHHNHGKQFWAAVAKACPQYEQYRAMLATAYRF